MTDQNEQVWEDVRADGGLPEAHTASNEIPRRADMRRWCEAERLIYEACLAVERMPADVRLTDAVVALGTARDRVADYMDAPGH